MAAFRPDSDRGYAMPAALILSLAMATMAAGLLGRSVGSLRLARSEFGRSQVEAALDGAQLIAAAAVVASRRDGPYHWITPTEAGWVDVLAEREDDKMSAAAAADLPDSALTLFGVQDIATLRIGLAAAGQAAPSLLISALDAAAPWQACAPSVVSVYGTGDHLAYAPPVEPGPGPNPASWRIGEIWRVRVATPDGWRDERIVRFTGDAQHPAATIARRWSRASGELGHCEELLGQISPG